MNKMTSECATETAALAAWLEEKLQARTLSISDGSTDGQTHEVMILPQGQSVASIKPLLDEYRAAPERRQGTAHLDTLDSFIAHVNRFKDDDSVVFANISTIKPSILAVLDYHCRGAKGSPRFGRHRASYACPLSEQWGEWGASNGKKMSQVDFAAFIENRIEDVIPPPDLDPKEDADKSLTDLSRLLGGKFAGPHGLMELSRGISINESAKATQAVNIASGEATLQYTSEHQDGQGQRIQVPNLFLIAIPVFNGGDLYRIPVRLRYRLAGGSVSWFYEMYRKDKVFDHAFREICQGAEKGTALPLLYGSPE
ncbi:MAG: DUF2303 family protein [Alphaproteobacteria bacterium]|nr:MAG: DUF2303 family protein [Alphaproteobacteria bacterium]